MDDDDNIDGIVMSSPQPNRESRDGMIKYIIAGLNLDLHAGIACAVRWTLLDVAPVSLDINPMCCRAEVICIIEHWTAMRTPLANRHTALHAATAGTHHCRALDMWLSQLDQ